MSELDELVNSWRRKCITYRVYNGGKSRRPMYHRFEVKGGTTPIQAMTENIYKTSPLLQSLVRGKK